MSLKAFISLRCMFKFGWVLIVIINPATARAWSFQGHSAIAQASVDSLGESTQSKINRILDLGPWCQHEPACTNAAARAGAWPDKIRDHSIASLFERYGSGTVPAALSEYANETSHTWHFVNTLFLSATGSIVDASPTSSPAKACPPKSYGLLFETWPKLLAGYKQSPDPRDKALILAFVLHMGADAYQPLHVLSALDDHCKGDKGGNAYCVGKNAGARKRCKKSLHWLWDDGFGVFDVKLSRPNAVFSGDHSELRSAAVFLQPNLGVVYPKKPQDIHSKTYQSKARKLTSHAVHQAIAHLKVTLSELEPRK